MYGLNDNDFFKVDANVHSSIKLRIIGGKGKDTFNINGKTNNLIYDLTTEKNFIVNPHNSEIRTSDNYKVNEYNPDDYEYNLTGFSTLTLALTQRMAFLQALVF